MSVRLTDGTDVEIVVRGELPARVTEYARRKVMGLVERVGDHAGHVRIRLTRQPDPAVTLPVRAQVSLQVRGQLVHVHVAATTGTEAVDMLVERLRHQLLRRKRHWEARRGRLPIAAPHEWRRGSEPSHHLPFFPRPVEERQIVVHRSFSPARMNPDGAAREMDGMGYAFYLFTEDATGGDAVIYRGGSTGYRLSRLSSGPTWLPLSSMPITLSPHPAASLTVAEARQRLDNTGLPFVFFADAETGRGSVLYHRYDGHYGLITPAQ